jgi:hypothetical protein
MDGKEFQAVLAVAQIVLLIDVVAASGTDEKAPSLRVIHIDPVAARPTLVHLDVKMTVIDHMPETAFVTYHEVPPFWMLFSIGRISIIKQAPAISLHSKIILLLFL